MALDHLEGRIKSMAALEELREKQVGSFTRRSTAEVVEQETKAVLEVVEARFNAAEINERELIALICMCGNLVHEIRWSENYYEPEIGPINQAIRKVQKTHGLKPGEEWGLGEGPDEYKSFLSQWDSVYDRTREDLIFELCTDRLRDIVKRFEYQIDDMKREGEQSLFQWDDKRRLYVLLQNYEREALQCESVGAYLAASILIAASIETRLIITCLEFKEICEKGRNSLNEERKSSGGKSIGRNPLSWFLDDLINVSAKCGWLPWVESNSYTFNSTVLAQVLKDVRNGVHPGKKVRKKENIAMGLEQYKDIRAANEILKSVLPARPKQK